MDVRIYWLWLVMVFGAAEPRLWKMGDRYDSAAECVRALQDGDISYLTDAEKERVNAITLDDAAEIIDSCEKKGIKVYCYESEGFPEQLRRIADPPAILFCRGNLDFLNNKITAAIVGSRSPSEYSVGVTDMLCKELCKRGCVIASGLADGIDTVAAKAATDCKTGVVGVLGREIDCEAALNNEAAELVSKNGAVISETCMMMKSRPLGFTKRNRILVGISDAVVFAECSSVSRGLDNAEHAISQGKQIFAVPPHDVREKRYFGQRELIRKGCKCVFGAEDIVYYLSQNRIEDLYFDRIGGDFGTFEDSAMFERTEKHRRKRKTVKPEIAEKPASEPKKNTDLTGLSGAELEICKLIQNEPMLADNIAAELNMEITDVLSALTLLELDGKVESLAGNRFALKHS